MDQENNVNHGDDMRDVENERLLDGKEIKRYGSEVSDKKVTFTQPLLVKRINTTSQIAIVGANVFPSLDYEIIENKLFKQDWRLRKKVKIFQYVLLKWPFPLLIGLGTGLVGIFNNIAVENIEGFKLLLTSDLMSQDK